MNIKKILCFILGLIFSATLFGCGNNTVNNTNNTQTKQTVVQQIKKERKVQGKAIDLGAGTFTVGKDIEPGTYDLIPDNGQQGYITVKVENNYDTSLSCIQDTLGYRDINDVDDNGTSKIRLTFVKGAEIEINDISKVHFKPVTSPFVDKAPRDTALYAGRFVVGEDIAPGRYKIVAIKGAGAVYIIKKNGSQSQQILSDQKGNGYKNDPKEASVTLKDGNIIFNSGIDQVEFIPQ